MSRAKLCFSLLILVILGQVSALQQEQVSKASPEQLLEITSEQTPQKTDTSFREETYQKVQKLNNLGTVWEDNIQKAKNFDELFTLYLSKVQERIDYLETISKNKKQECDQFLTRISDIEKAIASTSSFIKWLQEKITVNENQIKRIYDDRCVAHQQFLTFLKNQRITLRLIEFLKKAISNKSLVQLKGLGQLLQKYMDVKISNDQAVEIMLTELQQVNQEVGKSLQNQDHVRTSEEVGTKHIDDKRKELELQDQLEGERRTLGPLKQEFLALLQKFEDKVREEGVNRQNDEVALNEKVIEWTSKIEADIRGLTNQLASAQSQIEQVQSEIRTINYISLTCQAELSWVGDQIKSVQETYSEVNGLKGELEKKYKAQFSKVSSASLEVSSTL